MLVLTRKIGEQLVIAGVITVTVLDVEGQRVKFGIDAPADVSIVREELVRPIPQKPEPAPSQDEYPAPQRHSQQNSTDS